jgi:Flp pilus assembly pilin Flp
MFSDRFVMMSNVASRFSRKCSGATPVACGVIAAALLVLVVATLEIMLGIGQNYGPDEPGAVMGYLQNFVVA